MPKILDKVGIEQLNIREGYALEVTISSSEK